MSYSDVTVHDWNYSDEEYSDSGSSAAGRQPVRQHHHSTYYHRLRKPRSDETLNDELDVKAIYDVVEKPIPPVFKPRVPWELYGNNGKPPSTQRGPSPPRSRSRDRDLDPENDLSRRSRTTPGSPRPYLSGSDSRPRSPPSVGGVSNREESPSSIRANTSSSIRGNSPSSDADMSPHHIDHFQGVPNRKDHRLSKPRNVPGTCTRGREFSPDDLRSLHRPDLNRKQTTPEMKRPKNLGPKRTKLGKNVRRSSSSRYGGDSPSQTLLSRTATGYTPTSHTEYALFRYNDVQGTEFRLLRLLPGRTPMIECEIIPASLENHPAYVALSYAWGEADDTVLIQVDGFPIKVTSNLHSVLEALRQKGEPVLLWVDAVCINQHNKDEQSHQVQMMTRVYSEAEMVAVWLGPEADNSNLAISLLKEVVDESNDDEAMRKLIAAKENRARFTALVDLFERDYWHRLWVVQEVLNARSVMVYCGTTMLSWSVYVDALRAFKRHEDQLKEYYFAKQKKVSQRQRLPYVYILTRGGPATIQTLNTERSTTLLDLLCRCRKKLTCEPRDKVFGLFGILTNGFIYPFPPNYSASVREVYTNVVEFLLHTTCRFSVVCEAIYFPDYTSPISLPSWVPDWSHVSDMTSLGRQYQFRAASDGRAVLRFRSRRTKLEISAVCLDHVVDRGIAVNTHYVSDDILMAFLNWRAKFLNRHISSTEKINEDFCRTLCLDQVKHKSAAELVRICYHVFASLIRDKLPYIKLDDELQHYVDLEVIDLTRVDRSNFVYDHCLPVMRGRCFFMTNDGLMGIGTGALSAGDVICVPLGSDTPVVLRQGNNGEYRFIGDAYVDGYMYGKALMEVYEGTRELRKYVLH